VKSTNKLQKIAWGLVGWCVVFLVVLFELWAPAELKQLSWLEGLARLPGLHMALGMASAVAAYVNLWLLWHWLKKAGVYRCQPGWSRHLLRLAAACTVMVAVLLLGRWLWPNWTHGVPVLTRLWHLAVLVLAGGASYVAVLFVGGFRLRELRGA